MICVVPQLTVTFSLLASAVLGQMDGSKSRLDTLTGFLVLRYDSCNGAWQYRGAQLIAGTDTTDLSMMPAFYSPVYERNRASNKWIRNHEIFSDGRKFLPDRILSKVHDMSSPFLIPMDISNGLVQYGVGGPTSANARSMSIYISDSSPSAHRYIVLKAKLVVLSLSNRVFQHINPDEYLPSFDLACYPEVRTSHSVIHKFVSTTNCMDGSIEALGLIHLDDNEISLVVYE